MQKMMRNVARAACLWVVLSSAPSMAADDLAWPDEEVDAPAPRPTPKKKRLPAPAAKPPAPPKAPARPSQPAAPHVPNARPHEGGPGGPGGRGAAEERDGRAKAAGRAAGPAHADRPAGKAAEAKHGGAGKGPTQAPADADEEDEDEDEDEDVETVENVQAKGPAGGARSGGAAGDKLTVGGNDEGWTVAKLAGHLHAAVIHLPIAWWLAWAGAEALALVWPHPWLITSGLPLGAITALGFAPSVYTGLMRLEELAGGDSGYDAGPALWHRNLLLAAWTASVLALALRLANAQRRHVLLRGLYLALVFGGFLLVAYSAHLGGVLVYGEEFFPV